MNMDLFRKAKNIQDNLEHARQLHAALMDVCYIDVVPRKGTTFRIDNLGVLPAGEAAKKLRDLVDAKEAMLNKEMEAL